MRSPVHLRFLLVVACAAGLSLTSAPAAQAASSHHHPRFVLSSGALGVSGGELRGEAWALALEQPNTAPHPHCVLLGHGRIMYPGTADPCTVREGVPVFISGWTTFWSNLDDPFSSDPRVQGRSATDFDRASVTSESISIDGCGPINFLTPRFEVLSRQFHVLMAEPNDYGAPSQEISYVAHGWAVVIQGLRPGRHLIHTDFVIDFGEPFEVALDYVVDVVRRR